MKSAALIKTGNPFPGLRPFQEDEEFLFFGRENQIHTMIDKLAATHFLAVVGASGSGKSSLVNCGLRPALHRGLMANAGTVWRMAQFRPGGNSICALAGALAENGVLFRDFDSSVVGLADIIEASLRMSRLGLSRVFRDAQLPEQTNLLVVIDQFEELFRYRNFAELRVTEVKQRNQDDLAFVNLLLDPRSHPDLPIYIVLTMRSDFLGDCAEFAGLPEAINEGEYLIPRLTREERRAAISGPIGVGEAVISPALLTRLVNDVGDNPDQLSILQHALNRTWAQWDKEGKPDSPIELRHYEAIGTMARALDLHAERAYNELSTDRLKKICEKVFKALTDKQTDPRGIRRPTRFGVLCKVVEATPDELTAALSVFRKPSRSFLLPPITTELDEAKVVDISHESLMRIWNRLVSWIDDEVQSARQYRRLSESAALYATRQTSLWDDPQLQFALEWKDLEAPNEDWAELYGGGFKQAMDFLRESQRHRDEEKQEREKHREHELQQAKDLATERQRRLDDQAFVARKMRRWFRVVFAASLFLFALCVLCVFAFMLVLREKKASDAARTEMYYEALRERQSTLESLNSQKWLADQLLKRSHPRETALWYQLQGQARLVAGSYKAAQESLDQALKLAPEDASARTELGYLALLQNDPKTGLDQFEFIRDHIDRKSPINNLNLTVAYAALGKYAPAKISLQEAIKGMKYRQSEGGSESRIPPDVTRATGRLTLRAEGPVFTTALHYEQANIEAYTGDSSAYQAALKRADEEANSLPSAQRKEAVLVAMTWAWLHMGVQCPDGGDTCRDYGALAAQAALWKRAEYEDWAKCYYAEFLSKQKRFADARYGLLTRVVQQTAGNPSVDSACEKLRPPESDVMAFETRAKEALASEDFKVAKDNLAKAISRAGEMGGEKGREAERIRLLPLETDILIAYARAEKQQAETCGSEVEKQSASLNMLKKQHDSEINNAQRQKAPPTGGPGTAETLNQIENKYRGQLNDAKRKKDTAEEEKKLHEDQARVALENLKRDCTEIINKNHSAATAYDDLALAEWWLNGRETDAVRTALQHSLDLDLDNLDTLELLYELAPYDDTSRNAYFRKYRPLLDRYFRSASTSAETLEGQARLAFLDGRKMQALRLIATAIEMKPDSFDLYDLRAKIQRSLGFDDTQVRSALVSGYSQAGYALKARGDWRASSALEKEWNAASQVASRSDPADIRCNDSMSVCSFTRFANVESEEIYSRILGIRNDKGNVTVIQVTIDRGRDDGVIVGTKGEIWAQYLKFGRGHERPVMRIGTGEVVSVKRDSALVSIEVDHAQGDGLVRKGDMMKLRIPVPAGHLQSLMWSLAKSDVSFLDSAGMPLVDFQDLYLTDTPSREQEFVQYVLNDIRKSAKNEKDRPDLIPKGRFQGKTCYEAMSTANEAEVRDFLTDMTSYPMWGLYLTEQYHVADMYVEWLELGAELPK
jgi:hypothetical protein